IIHSSDEDYIIAEPRTDVVEQMENIAELICTPPLAITSVCRKDLLCVKSDTNLQSVIGFISSSGYSNLPVYENGALIGVANGQKIINLLGEQINNKINIADYLENTLIGDVIQKNVNDNYYTVVDAKLTIEEALNLFYTNRKLLAILITKTGNYNEPALGIITVSDIIDLNAMLDNYGIVVK
ncbi:MAG: CBS domain-containing protein, partial [Christensenellales bacterium]